mmetsp:Transcript_30079/g.47826  ORF Transcript_30079/g.47826 Transcript_30079/m.47826 type:complete len:623 (+) Transcript_30079:34-1902(+)
MMEFKPKVEIEVQEEPDESPLGNMTTGRAGTALTWSRVGFKVQDRVILGAVDGRVDPGEVFAVIGPSGAGKSTLLNILAGRVRSKAKGTELSGSIYLNGVEVNPWQHRKKIAYVMQDDALVALATPREAFELSARLRLPGNTSKEHIKTVVDGLVCSLGLQAVENSYIGSQFVRGLSGGERKRVSIGVELVTNPDLLFLDEPTSGLDSFSAYKLVGLLQSLAKSNSAILCTIHSPSSETFAKFDRVMLLQRGGTVMYNGTVKNVPQIFDIPALTNPADYMLHLAQVQPSGTCYYDADQVKSSSQELASTGTCRRSCDSDLSNGAARVPFYVEVDMLVRREFRSFYRNKTSIKTRLIVCIVQNILFSCVFLWAGNFYSPTYTVTTHFASFTNVIVQVMFATGEPVMLELPSEKLVFIRDYSTKTYSAGAYLLAKVIIELPVALFMSIFIVVLTYFLQTWHGNFFEFVFSVWLLMLVAVSLAWAVGAWAKDANHAMGILPLIFVPQILFTGFFVQIQQIPVWLRWINTLIPLRYAMNIALINEFADDMCPMIDLTVFPHTPVNETECLKLDQNCPRAGCHSILETNQIRTDYFGVYVAALLIMFVGLRLIAMFGLMRSAKRHSS